MNRRRRFSIQAVAVWIGLLALPTSEAAGGGAQTAGRPPALQLVCDGLPVPGESAPPLPMLELSVREPALALRHLCASRGWQEAGQTALLAAQMGFVLGALEREPDPPLAEFLALAGADKNPLAQAWQQLALARSLMKSLDNKGAATALQTGLLALADRDDGLSPLLRAALLTAQAGVQRRVQANGWADRVDANLNQATQLLQSEGLALSALMGEVLNQRTMWAYAKQDLNLSLHYAEAEAELLRGMGLGDAPAMLDALASLGGLHGQLEQMEASRKALEQGLAIIDRHPNENISAQLGILHNLAANASESGQMGEGVELAERALALAEKQFGATSPRVLPSLLSLGLGRLRRAQYGAALAVSERCEALVAKHGRDVGPGRVLRAKEFRASLWRAMGQPLSARAVLDEAMPLAEGRAEQGYWQARLLRQRAELSLQAGDGAAAERDFAAALPLLTDSVGKGSSLVLSTLAGRCRASLLAPGAQACVALLQHIAEHLDYVGQLPESRARAHLSLARWQEARGDSAPALHQHLLGLAAAQSQGGPQPLWENLHGLARYWAARGRQDLALQLGQQSLLLIEDMRRDLRQQASRFERGFLFVRAAVYRDQAAWLAHAGRLAEATAVMRDWQALELDEFSDGALGARRGGEESDPQPWPWLIAEPFKPTEHLGPKRYAEAQQRWRLLSQSEPARLAQWQQWLAAQSVPVQTPEPARLRVAAGELHVWAIARQQDLTLLLVHAGASTQLRVALPADKLASEVGELLQALATRAPVVARLQRWYGWIGAPIEQAARAAKLKRVVLHLDGALRYVPLALLQSAPGPTANVVRSGSGATPAYLGAKLSFVHEFELRRGQAALNRRPAMRIKAFGSSLALAGLPALPAVVQELCDLVAGPIEGLSQDACGPAQGLLPGGGWLDAGFTRQTLLTELASAARGTDDSSSYVHLGTHFTLRPGAMARSWLRLGDGERLYLNEMARLPFDGVSLVTLSACATGIGSSGTASTAVEAGGASGAEWAGLNAGLLEAGAQAVLASLWPVDDVATGQLMQAFYQQLRGGRDAAEALRLAQLKLQGRGERFAHPFYWGAFYLARPLTPSRSSSAL